MADDRPPTLNALDREAIDWVQRLDAQDARVAAERAADREAAQRWCAQSAEHEAAFARASRVWRQFEPAARNLRRRGEIPDALPSRSRRMTRRTLVGAGVAAAAATLVVAAVRPPLDLWPSLAELTADYRTGTGEQTLLALRAGVSMRLNAQTSVAMRPPDAGAERVELISGQASFTTSAQSEHGLVVLAGDGMVTATSSRFDIQCFDGAVQVTCLAGELRVLRHSDAVVVGPGRQVRYDRNRFDPVAPADVEMVSAWEDGVLIFRMTPLSEVVAQINRYRSGRVVLLDRELARKTVSGRFRIDRIEDILPRLNQALGLKNRVLPGGVILLT
ncbi:FecR domain-containing protein [Bradyrhizobium sp. U87765 SZCCT0131]|uniref:FecR family protein n=1 Tax=unclassified Bradyrhizobium TaxID=2631580 RepID=UPI001BA58BD8|nr:MULTISPECIES: FecR domain-containing protein [unclassified Bradyrhizobium]MBR1220901.1 FecR domain-containing protein [Bradyrhizobium sp. U87765 SZCCT0131]MBR1260279.1 FecR domain-containing protein [Bradyrhizobium sp. U87765 SZCCT0134]MBR1307472.1 FecR domain-containing protein [Bradyrhizobium sp. U87765 SZCCT0110]MBR1321426.1 FecR domain-containing protein [Bradyrhizobium sp. U87765 SZCCT0109]MBR1349739.1 FecR domain-containing protein [Bradyrhizobium sp. U87765 SZCCT0048]